MTIKQNFSAGWSYDAQPSTANGTLVGGSKAQRKGPTECPWCGKSDHTGDCDKDDDTDASASDYEETHGYDPRQYSTHNKWADR